MVSAFGCMLGTKRPSLCPYFLEWSGAWLHEQLKGTLLSTVGFWQVRPEVDQEILYQL